MADDLKQCLRCGSALGVEPGGRVQSCPLCGTPHARHDLSPEKFPLTLKLISGTTGAIVWSRTVSIDEARELAKIEIPSFAGSAHYPVRAEIEYADGTTEVRGAQ